VNHPIVVIEGLPQVKTHEVVLFESGQKGEVFTITRGRIEVRIFSHEPVKVGTKATRTDQLLSIAVGPELLGKVINPLGEPLDASLPFTPPKEFRDLDAKPTGISGRQKITAPMITGVSLVDQLIPLGRGQRELIIGDRKTGKTSLLLSTIKKQASEGIIAVYAAIAKKKSDIKRLQEFFVQEKVSQNVILVATSSYDSPSLIFQTPYAAMAIAEYFREKGTNTLLVLDDLSTHAKFYRELSLLARRFPGRDSYPGDIFYVHSKLLERAGNFKHPIKGEVAISCLPVVEIVEGDLTSYISTNVMGITDGHVYFDSNMYYKGMRPAVNIPLSVTRVGRQTLSKLSREINKELTAFLSMYDKVQNLSHFGQELTDDVKKSLARGDLVYAFFNQPYQLTVPANVQLVILSFIMQDIITDKKVMENAREKLTAAYENPQTKELFDSLIKTSDLKVFKANVLAQKDKILLLCQVASPQATPPTPTSPLPAPQSPPQVAPQVAQPTQPAVKVPTAAN
jgi:F-type H+-transporting ATPase subunit alpha